jgi:hemoglobin-like flavoprotein
MTADAVERVQEHFDHIRTRGLAERFYELLFSAQPELRALFPQDLAEQMTHFTNTLALVIEHLGRVTAVDADLRALGARHLQYGAQPQHYTIVRDLLVTAIEEQSGPDWNHQLAHDWRIAITMVIVPMLRGAAVETANIAQAMAAEDSIPG